MPPADRAGATPSDNPYKGPLAFEEKDAAWFFGRDADAQTLTALTVSERLVLFCAQSGAGKTSLINARLIPELSDLEFNVLPVARVSGELPSRATPHNVYAYCTLKTLAKTRRPEDTLDGFLRTSRDGDSRPRVLILDQFEEILSAHPEHWQQREEFFRQLRRALQEDPTLSVLLVMREDRIAGLERYIPLVSGHLRARFRMERLRWEQAVEAIREPAARAGRPFDKGVAEGLATDLCQMRIADQEKPIIGEFVEPVQLQVVCHQLWENLKDKPGETITEDDLKKCGNVNEALESFYQSALERASRESGVTVTRLRYWCETVLITPTGIRAQVPRESDATGGLPNKAIDSLVDAHLIRPEEARGGIWYELAHDRLVQPVLQSNQKAQKAAGPKRLVVDAQKWKSSGQSSNLLYSGQRLKEMLQSEKVRQGALSPLEKEFLDAARTQQMRRLIAALSLVVVMTLALLSYLYWQSRNSFSRELAMASITKHESDPDLALRLALEALNQARSPEAEAALHQALGASVARQQWTALISSDAAGALALNPDGSRVAVVGSDGRLRLLETGSGRTVQTGPLIESPVSTLAFNPRGRQLAVGDVGGQILLWDLEGQRASRTFTLESGINRLAFSPDGTRLAVATNTPTPVVLDLRTGEPVLRLEGHQDFVWAIAFSFDGRFLATGSEDHTAMIWDAQSGRSLSRLSEHGKAVTAVAFSSSGMLATASQDNLAIVWDLDDGKKQFLYGHRDWLWDVAFSADGEQLATASQDGTVKLWQTDSGRQIRTLLPVPQVGPVLRVTFGAREGELAAAAKSLRNRKEEPGTVSLWTIVFRDVPSLDNGSEVTSLAYSPDGNLLAVGDEQGMVSLWNRGGRRIGRLASQDAPIHSLAFDPVGKVLAIAGVLTDIELWEVSSRRKRGSLSGQESQIQDVAFSPDGTRLASAGTNGVAILWDVARRQPLHRLLGHRKPVLDVAFSRDGQWLATAGADSTVRLWHPESGRELRVFRGHGSAVLTVAFCPKGNLLASGSVDKTARIWDPRDGKELLVLKGHAGAVTEVAFTPDGERLATGSVDQTIKIWKAETGAELFALTGNTGSILGLAFQPPDGWWLATPGSDKSVRLAPMQIDDLIRLALERKPRPLTKQERRIYLHR
jgi:WD40 repeat protein